MKTLDELIKEMTGKTQLQQSELVGSEVQLVGEITQITTRLSRVRSNRISGTFNAHRSRGRTFQKQLLGYSVGDVVRMATRFTAMTSDPDCYHFNLVSIVRLHTRKVRRVPLLS